MDMKINKKQIILVAVIAVVLLAGLIIGGKVLVDQQEQKKIDAIHAAYTEAIDANISAYLNRSESEQSYEQREFCINDVAVEVNDIYFEKDSKKYIISVSTYVQTAVTTLDETDLSLISHDVSNSVLRLAKKNGLSGNFTLAGNQCCYRASGSISGNTVALHDPLITVYVNEQVGSTAETTIVELDDDKDTVKCASCGNKYKEGSDNAKSIDRTNMCKSCYDSYKTMSDALNELPVQ